MQPEAVRALRDRAQAERQAPARTGAVAPPSGLEQLGTALPEAGGLRDAGLEAALARVPAVRPKPAGEPVDDATERQSIKLYVRGKTALVENRFADAVKDLGDATELNPDAPEPWQALAQAQARSGRVREAVASLRRGFDAGSTDPSTLMTLWRALRLERKWEDAASVSVRLRSTATDAGLSVIADTAVGESLISIGAAGAGADLIADALERSARVESARWAEESSELVRRRRELWTDVGDVRLRLGRYDDALAAYVRAEAAPGAEPASLIERRVYTLLRAGRVGAAAELVVDDADSGGPGGAERTAGLARLIAGTDAPAAGLISSALLGIADDPTTTSMTRRARLIRAAAAGQEVEQARTTLLARLERTPDDSLIDDLLGRLAPADATALLSQAGEVLRRAPGSLERVTALVLRRGVKADQLAASRAGVTGPGARAGADALSAAVLVRAGRFAEALKIGEEGDAAHGGDPRWLLWRTRIAVWGADWPGAERSARALVEAAERDPANLVLAARAMSILQRPREALGLYEKVIARGGAGVRDLLSASDISKWLGKADESERYTRQAAEADPLAETPRLELLESEGRGSDPDARSLSAMIRELREVSPQSRGLRLIRARELLRSRQFVQALGEYSAMLAETPDDDDAGAGLLNATMSMPAADPALGRLKVRLGQLKDAATSSAWPALADAALAVRTAKTDDEKAAGARALDAVFERVYDGDVMRVWAALSRESLGTLNGPRHVLEKLGAYPANIDVSAARAAAHLQLGEVKQAADLLAGLPEGMGLRPSQASPLLLALETPASAAVDAARGPRKGEAAEVLRALTQVFERAGRLSPTLHAARLELMVADKEFDLPALVKASDEAAGQVGDPGAVYAWVAMALATQGMKQGAVEYARMAAAQEPADQGDRHVLWMDMAQEFGSAQDAVEAVRAACEPARLDATTRALVTGQRRRVTPTLHRADIAYTVANRLASRGLDDAVLAYELALEFDPDHRLTNNDLGYLLLEQDVRREDAARMLERAHSIEPLDANVCDSIGWLRYLQGRLEDGPEGEGAVTLLRRAVDLDSESNPTLRDHLGDALYRTGARDDAVRMWNQAANAAASLLNRAGDRAPAKFKSKYEELKAGAMRKQMAVGRGNPPQIAPTWAEKDAAKAAKQAAMPGEAAPEKKDR
jgi:tetratricopeptide (TPR) repeat protein